MGTEYSRLQRRRRRSWLARWGEHLSALALAAIGLTVGALYQDPVRYGWLAAAMAAFLLLRLGLVAEDEPVTAGDGRPGAGWWAWSALMIGLHGLGIGAITWQITSLIGSARGAADFGNEALWVAAAWGAYGLLLVLTAPLAKGLPWLALGRLTLLASLGFLLVAGLLANARWADPLPRMAAYGAVLGGIWLSGAVQARRGALGEADRLLGLGAAALGFAIGSFEVARWLEPHFTLPMGTFATPSDLIRQRWVQAGWSLATWTSYALLVWGAGRVAPSPPVRALGLALGAMALLYGLVTLAIWALR